jgi:hypothetical protein
VFTDDVVGIRFLWTGIGTGSFTVGSAISPYRQPPSALDGQRVYYRCQNPATPTQLEYGYGTYNHGALTITRNPIYPSSPVNFSATASKIIEVVLGNRELLLIGGGGATINEVSSTPGTYDFLAGGQYKLGYTDQKHSYVKLLGPSDGALTASMYVALPDPAEGPEGHKVLVKKGDGSSFAVTVVGFDNPVAVSANATSDVLTFTGFSPIDGDPIILHRGTAPGNLTLGTIYFARDSSGSTCKLAATVGGSAIDLSSAGSGFVACKGRQVLTRRDQWLKAWIVGSTTRKWERGEQEPVPTLSSRDLAAGAGTLTLADWMRISGTAGASFDLTVPNGGLNGQLITIDADGTFGANAVALKDAAGNSIHSTLKQDVLYRLQWVSSSSTWRKAGTLPRSPGSFGTLVRGNGELAPLAAGNAATAITESITLTAAHQYVKIDGTDLVFNTVQVQHASPSTAIDITIPDSSSVTPAQMIFVLEKPAAQTGLVRLLRQTNGTLNGSASPISLAFGRARVAISIESNPGSAPACWVKGDTTEEQTLAGNLHGGGNQVIDAEFRDSAETVVAKGTLGSGAISFDYSAGPWQWGTTGGGNITSVAITNPPASGKLGCITLEFVQGATPRTIAWGSAFRFPGGTDHSLTASTGAVDVFTLTTRDGGTTWYVFQAGKGMAA